MTAARAWQATSVNSSGNVSDLDITLPGSITAGTAIYLQLSINNNSNAAVGSITTSGYTQVGAVAGGSDTTYIFRKIADGSEGGTTVRGHVTIAGRMSLQAVGYTGVDTTTPEVASSFVSNTATSNANTLNNPAYTTTKKSLVISFASDKGAPGSSSVSTQPTVAGATYTSVVTTGALSGSAIQSGFISDAGVINSGVVVGGGTWTFSATTTSRIAGIFALRQAPIPAFTPTVVGFNLTVDGSASTAVSPATVASYDWDWGDGTTHGTGATPATHSYSTSGVYTVTLTVTDSDGATGFVTAQVTIASLGRTNTVQSITTSTNWTASSGTVLNCVTDGVATTFITSQAPPTAQVFKVVMSPVLPPAVGQPYKVFVTCDAVTASAASFTAKLYEPDGTTLRSTLTSQTVTGGSGSSVLPVTTLTFPATDVANMSTGGWSGGFILELDATAS